MMSANENKRPRPIPALPRKRRGGPPKGSANARTHGHYQRKAALSRIGFDGIDRRTSAGREYSERREQIVADAGGTLSQIKADLVERYMRLCVLIDSLDTWLFQQPSLINKRKRALFPIVKERTHLEDAALRLAQSIGLDRKEKPVPTLAEYLAGKAESDVNEHFNERKEHSDD